MVSRFVYFAFTTLYHWTAHIPTTSQTLDKPRVGVHSACAVMVYGGLCFGFANSSFLMFSVVAARCSDRDRAQFSGYLSSQVPDLLQTLGTVLAKRLALVDGWGSRKSPLW